MPSKECENCMGGEEDCSHLFFECPFAQEIWYTQNLFGVDVTSDGALWGSLKGGVFRRETEWERILAVLWAIWWH